MSFHVWLHSHVYLCRTRWPLRRSRPRLRALVRCRLLQPLLRFPRRTLLLFLRLRPRLCPTLSHSWLIWKSPAMILLLLRSRLPHLSTARRRTWCDQHHFRHLRGLSRRLFDRRLFLQVHLRPPGLSYIRWPFPRTCHSLIVPEALRCPWHPLAFLRHSYCHLSALHLGWILRFRSRHLPRGLGL